MGNAAGKCFSGRQDFVRVMTMDGRVKTFMLPISVGEVLQLHPGNLLLDTHSVHAGKKSRVPPSEVIFMDEDMTLEQGRLYVLFRTENEKSKVLKGEGHGTRAQPTVSARDEGRPDTQTQLTAVRDSVEQLQCKKPMLGPSLSGSRARSRSRRRGSSEQDKVRDLRKDEETAVETPQITSSFCVNSILMPTLRDIFTDKHQPSWCPALKSIPESPANSSRSLDVSPAVSKPLCTPPPKHGNHINKLLKQAFLYKYSRSLRR